MIDDGCDAWFALEAPPAAPAPLRVYAQKRRQANAVFEAPHDAEPHQIIAAARSPRNGGFDRAMVVIK